MTVLVLQNSVCAVRRTYFTMYMYICRAGTVTRYNWYGDDVMIYLYVTSHCVSAGERLEDSEVDLIMKLTDTQEDLDGNIKYEGWSGCDTVIHHGPTRSAPKTWRNPSWMYAVTGTCIASCTILLEYNKFCFFAQISSRRSWPLRSKDHVIAGNTLSLYDHMTHDVINDRPTNGLNAPLTK